MNIASVGRFGLNQFKYITATAVNIDSDKYLMMTSQPRFMGQQRPNEDSAVVFRSPKQVKLNSHPAIAGAILGWSKMYMASEIYYELKPALGPGTHIAYSDTDSLVMHVPSKSYEEAMEAILHRMDTSNFPPESPFFSLDWKAVCGRWKDEVAGSQVFSFVSPREKVYSLATVKKEDVDAAPFGVCFDDLMCDYDFVKTSLVKRCRGLPRAAAARLTHQMYMQAVRSCSPIYADSVSIVSKECRLITQKQRRVALFGCFMKRKLYPCGIHTEAFKSPRPRERCHTCYDEDAPIENPI